TAQLVNVAGGYHLWSERFDREPEDVFAIQEEIARTIAERLQVSLAGSDQMTLVRPHTENLEAYQLYLKGRGFINRRGHALWPAPTGSSARHCSSTRATCKPAAGTGCSTCSGCTAGMRRGLRRRRARSK